MIKHFSPLVAAVILGPFRMKQIITICSKQHELRNVILRRLF